MNKERAKRLGHDTVAIINTGEYFAGDKRVDLRKSLQLMVDNTEVFGLTGNVLVDTAGLLARSPIIEVTEETTLAACKRLMNNNPLALNFASAKRPGGGFLDGASTQEESLARATTLYASIKDQKIYAIEQAKGDPLYTDWAIYSPHVAVIRSDDGWLLPEPFLINVITCPAPNAKVVLERDPSREKEVNEALFRRIAGILGLAAKFGHRTLVLGAWGCGVFGNDPSLVASLFKTDIMLFYGSHFERVVFAIYDPASKKNFEAFRSVFEPDPS